MNLPTSVQEMEYELYPKNGEQMWESYKQYSEECGQDYDDDLGSSIYRRVLSHCYGTL